MWCKNHITKEAVFHCVSCEGNFCQECIKEKKFNYSYVAYICKECGGKCVDVRPEIDEEAQIMVSAKNFWQQLPKIFLYPFRGDGLYIMIGGTVVFAVLNYSFLSFILGSFYTTACLVNIVRASIVPNNDQPPQWPDSLRWLEWLLTSCLLVAAGLLCYAPAMYYLNQVKEADAFYWFLVVVGSYFFPMYFLSVCLNENLAALNPLNIIFSIIRTISPYTSLVVFWFSLFLMKYFIEKTLLPHIPLLGYILKWFLFVYFLFVSMRAVGIFYRANKDKLLGFDEE